MFTAHDHSPSSDIAQDLLEALPSFVRCLPTFAEAGDDLDMAFDFWSVTSTGNDVADYQRGRAHFAALARYLNDFAHVFGARHLVVHVMGGIAATTAHFGCIELGFIDGLAQTASVAPMVGVDLDGVNEADAVAIGVMCGNQVIASRNAVAVRSSILHALSCSAPDRFYHAILCGHLLVYCYAAAAGSKH